MRINNIWGFSPGKITFRSGLNNTFYKPALNFYVMKRIMQIFYFVTAMFVVTITSCQKESIEPPMELTIDGMQKVLFVNNNGIGIKFCLLNENGEPATVFKEGENFRFYLEIINNVEPDTAMYLPLWSGLGYGWIPDNLYVFNAKGDTIGRPFYFRGAYYILEACPKIKKGDSFVLDIPWTENRENWLICNVMAHGSKNEPLPKGKYYTRFVYQFCLNSFSLFNSENPDDFICTDRISYKINFKIE